MDTERNNRKLVNGLSTKTRSSLDFSRRPRTRQHPPKRSAPLRTTDGSNRRQPRALRAPELDPLPDHDAQTTTDERRELSWFSWRKKIFRLAPLAWSVLPTHGGKGGTPDSDAERGNLCQPPDQYGRPAAANAVSICHRCRRVSASCCCERREGMPTLQTEGTSVVIRRSRRQLRWRRSRSCNRASPLQAV